MQKLDPNTQHALSSVAQPATATETKRQKEHEDRETLMELEHTLADLRSQKQELAAGIIGIETQEVAFEAAWQRVRKQISSGVASAHEKPGLKPVQDQSQSNPQTLSPMAQRENVERDANRGQAAEKFGQAAVGQERTDAPQIASAQVANDKPHPQLRPSPELAAGVDRAAHLHAKSQDNERSRQASGKQQAIDQLATGLQEKAGNGQHPSQDQSIGQSQGADR